MKKCKNWLLLDKDGKDIELTAELFGELSMLVSFIGISMYNLLKGKDNKPLLIVMLGFLAGKGIGQFVGSREKKHLVSGILHGISGALYTASYVLENKDT